jgi:hypothetical protein
VDVGQSVQFTADPDGGSRRYAFAWTGLPSTCTGATTPTPVCTMADAGTVSARVTASDSNSAHVGPTSPVNVTVFTDPSVGAIIVAPRTVSSGSSVVLGVAVAGGSGDNRYSWIGLPTGCQSADTPQLTCQPTQTGTFNVAVNVVDGNGFLALGNESNLTVVAASSSSSSTVGGVSESTLFGAIAIAAVAVAVVELVLLVRKRK